MRICLAQTRPASGDIDVNIQDHLMFIQQAAENNADLIFFSELSLTGYEPDLTDTLAMNLNDNRLDVLQAESDKKNLTICVGIPLKSDQGISISMVIFQPDSQREVYTKKYLHPDEEPFFVGDNGTVKTLGANQEIALAICYEISIPDHEHFAMQHAPEIYLASVAKFESGIAPAHKRLSELARNHKVFALMVNAVGPADNGICLGQSAVWDKNGNMLDYLSAEKKGILILDTEKQGVFRQDID